MHVHNRTATQFHVFIATRGLRFGHLEITQTLYINFLQYGPFIYNGNKLSAWNIPIQEFPNPDINGGNLE